MKILVLGAGGMVGHVIAIRLAELGNEVTGFARKQLPFCKTIMGDALTARLPEIVREYDVVINCIGVLNKAVNAEPHKGIWLNSYLPHLLAKHAKRVIHISTDCVFSGQDGGDYSEESYCSADTLYGRSKALGELIDDRNLTIRTSVVGADINKNGIGLFNWFMKQRGTVEGYTAATWGGVTNIVLAESIHEALMQGVTGLYHLTNGVKISKFELLELFNELRCKPIRIIPSDAVNEDKSLVSVRSSFVFEVPSYMAMAKGMGEWIITHGKLYRQYETGELK